MSGHMTNLRFVFSHLNWAFSKVRRVVLLLLLCVIYCTFCNLICGELMNFHKYSVCIRKQDLFSIISVQIRTLFFVLLVFSVSLLVPIPFTFFSLSMMCQNLLVFICFCILAFPEVSALGRWLICRKFPTYLSCELWPLPLKSFLLCLICFSWVLPYQTHDHNPAFFFLAFTFVQFFVFQLSPLSC